MSPLDDPRCLLDPLLDRLESLNIRHPDHVLGMTIPLHDAIEIAGYLLILAALLHADKVTIFKESSPIVQAMANKLCDATAICLDKASAKLDDHH